MRVMYNCPCLHCVYINGCIREYIATAYMHLSSLALKRIGNIVRACVGMTYASKGMCSTCKIRLTIMYWQIIRRVCNYNFLSDDRRFSGCDITVAGIRVENCFETGFKYVGYQVLAPSILHLLVLLDLIGRSRTVMFAKCPSISHYLYTSYRQNNTNAVFTECSQSVSRGKTQSTHIVLFSGALSIIFIAALQDIMS